MALSVHSWHSIRLSAHEGVLAGVWARRSFGPHGLGRPLLAMSHEPRAEQNAKNEPIRPLISRKQYWLPDNNIN